MIKQLLFLVFSVCFTPLVLARPIVNVYTWANEIPMELIWQFEQETGIKVNLSTYDSNETMYTKLRANKTNIYDVVVPSTDFIERLLAQHLLTKLDMSKLPNIKNLDPMFQQNDYDPNNQHSIPLVWGSVGLYYNDRWVTNPPTSWRMLWDSRWRNQLMILDDIRSVFSVTLLSLGYDPNDENPQHIAAAYQDLLRLVPNIKLFGSYAIQSAIIDEDANLGMSWNGDIVKAFAENPHIRYLYPQDGFILWIDCLAIPAHAPHLNEAHQFINFLLKAQSGAAITLQQGYATPNLAGKQLLPLALQQNPVIFPSPEILKRGHIVHHSSEETLELYNQYWQQLKLAF